MFFQLLNNNQNSIAASCILVLGICQISLDSWTLYKIQEHEEVIMFLSGAAVPASVNSLTYEQAISYFTKLKQFLSPDLLSTLDTLQMTAILGIVAGILQLFSSTGALMWKGMTVDIFWLSMNFIAGIFLSVAVSYIAIYMIRDVPYHQALLTVTAVNLFISLHIWVVNLIALIRVKWFEKGSESASTENINASSSRSRSHSGANSNNYFRTEENTQMNTNTTTRDTTVVR